MIYVINFQIYSAGLLSHFLMKVQTQIARKAKRSGLENGVKMPGRSTILQKGNIQNIPQFPQK